MEREAITQITGVEDEDILYVCYANRIGELLERKTSSCQASTRPRCNEALQQNVLLRSCPLPSGPDNVRNLRINSVLVRGRSSSPRPQAGCCRTTSLWTAPGAPWWWVSAARCRSTTWSPTCCASRCPSTCRAWTQTWVPDRGGAGRGRGMDGMQVWGRERGWAGHGPNAGVDPGRAGGGLRWGNVLGLRQGWRAWGAHSVWGLGKQACCAVGAGYGAWHEAWDDTCTWCGSFV